MVSTNSSSSILYLTFLYLQYKNVCDNDTCRWGAIVAILTAILSIIAANKGVVVAAITLGSIGALIAVVGASVDGVAAGVINSLVACGGPSGVYGSTTDQAALAFSCNTYLTGNDCSCIDNDYNLCYEYDLANSADTCNIMLTTYPKSLSASCAFCAIIAIICFTISVIGCVEQCCNKEKLVESTTTHNSTDNKA